MAQLTDKIAVIIGGNSGIGLTGFCFRTWRSAAEFCRSTCLVFQASVAAIRAKALIKRISGSNISTEFGKENTLLFVIWKPWLSSL
jgi:hypothetical protein